MKTATFFFFSSLLLTTPAYAGAPTAPSGTGPAPAEPAPLAESPTFQRQGFTLGGGLYLASASDNTDDESLGGLGLSLRIGGSLSPRVALVLDIESFYGEEHDAGVGITFVGGAVIGFVSDSFFLTGGLGGSKISVETSSYEDETDTMGTLLLGAGIEFAHSGTTAFSGELRVLAGGKDDYSFATVLLGVAVQLY